jgi:hypothetical protein
VASRERGMMRRSDSIQLTSSIEFNRVQRHIT